VCLFPLILSIMFAYLAYALGAVFVALYWKGVPGVFHLRLAASVLLGAFWEGRLRSVTEHVESTERVLLCDMDINLHQNNSIYNLLADVSRYHWLSRLLAGNLSRYRQIKIANGGVSMFFLRELRFFQKYSVSTFCLGMDDKWAYMRAEFCSGGRGSKRVVHAVGVCRLVFKELSGKTIRPADFFRSLGYSVDEKLVGHGIGASKTALLGHLHTA
jgi:hypothetical protein